MATEKELAIKLLLQDKEFVSKFSTAFDKIGSASQKKTDSMNLAWAGLASQFYLVQNAIQPVIGFMNTAIQAAGEQEDAVARLNVALQNQGTFTEELSLRYQKMSEDFQRSSRFSDDAIQGVQQTLITFGNVGPLQMERVTKAVLDLATAKRISLSSAADIVAKAASGSTTALSKMGIVIDENTPKAQKFAKALEGIEARTSGAAAADLNTYTGQMQNLQNVWQKVMGEIGAFVTESPKVTAFMKGMADAAGDLAINLKKVREERPDLLAEAFSVVAKVMAGPAALGMQMGADLSGMKGPAQNQQPVREASGVALGSNAQAAVEAAMELEAHEKSIRAMVDQTVMGEELKLQTILASTDIMKSIKNEQTLTFLENQKKELEAVMTSESASIQTKQNALKMYAAIAESQKKIEQDKNKALHAAELEKYKLNFELATATADLASALATATGSSALKGVSIVLNAVVAAAQAMIAIRAASNPLDAAIAGVRLATVAVAAANAFTQIGAAEKALEASKNQQIQAVTNVQGLAVGTPYVYKAGYFDVGERGRERVYLPAGAAVEPSGGFDQEGSKTISQEIHIHINGDVLDLGDFEQRFKPVIGRIASDFISDEKNRL